VFDRIVDRQLPRRIANRGVYSFFTGIFQSALMGAALFVSAHPAAVEPDLPPLQVQFVRSVGGARSGPARPRAPRAALPGRPAGPRTVLVAKKAPPAALLQPHEVIAEIRIPNPGEAPEEFGGGGGGEGDEEAVVGGVPDDGGESEENLPPALSTGGDGGIEEAAQYFTAGFRRPVEENPGCFAASLRLPPDLTGFISEVLTVKFVVGREGRIGKIELLSQVPDRRIALAIENALRICHWRPGADGTGQPIALWVILPLRFQGG